MAITTRTNKGSALTHAEMDANFTDFMVLSGAGASRTLTGVYATSLGAGVAATGTSGEIRATGNIIAYASSDINLKENIAPIENAVQKVRQINGVYFDWKDDVVAAQGGPDEYFVRKHDVGVIAQEVEQVLPEVVATRQDGTKAVRYEKLVALLIEAVKEQQQTIDRLNKRLDALDE